MTKERKTNMKLKENGVTLIALVITIIVLLILAGVTLSALTGDSGILSNAEKAKKETEIANEKEIIKISLMEALIPNMDKTDFQEVLQSNCQPGNKAYVLEENEDEFIIQFESKRYYLVDNKGNVEHLNNVKGAKILTIQCINSQNEVMLEEKYTVLTNTYSKKLPTIDGYKALNELIQGEISKDLTIQVPYYLICNDEKTLVFTGMDENGEPTDDESNIKAYKISGLKDESKNIESIVIIPENYKDKKVTLVESFRDCQNIKSAEINAELICGAAFLGCTKLEKVIIGKDVRKIEEYAFESCTNLTDLIMNSEDVTFNGHAIFVHCDKLKDIKISEEIKTYKTINGVLYTFDEKELIQVLPGVENIVISSKTETICEYSFTSNTKIKEVIIPDGLTTIGYGAFYGCSGMESIRIPESVENMADHIFRDCTGLKRVSINSKTTGWDSFWNCYSLEEVNIGTNVKTIQNLCFEGCTELTVINYLGTMEEWNLVNKEAGWEQGADNLTTIKCTDGDIAL